MKTSRHSSHRSRNYFVPPPPPYAPSIVVSALGMTNTQPAAANDAMLEKSVDSYQGDMPAQIGGPNAYLTSVSAYLRVEKKVHKEIDQFDSEISNHEKEIGRLLNL